MSLTDDSCPCLEFESLWHGDETIYFSDESYLRKHFGWFTVWMPNGPLEE